MSKNGDEKNYTLRRRIAEALGKIVKPEKVPLPRSGTVAKMKIFKGR